MDVALAHHDQHLAFVIAFPILLRRSMSTTPPSHQQIRVSCRILLVTAIFVYQLLRHSYFFPNGEKAKIDLESTIYEVFLCKATPDTDMWFTSVKFKSGKKLRSGRQRVARFLKVP
jgi:hypothetical protein